MIDLFGHRGAAGEAPENTLAGFAFAYGIGLRCLELDVHLTRDGDLAVIHDNTLDRTTNGKGHVGGYTMAELGKFNACGPFETAYPDARISSLTEILGTYASRIRLFQIEIKTDRPFILDMVCRKVCDALADFEIAGKTVVTSFDPYAIRAVRAIMPRQNCGLISMSYKESDVDLAKELGCYNTCIPLRTGGSPRLVEIAHRLGLEVTGWLGNTVADVDTLLEWGVDSITSNYPSLIFPYLASKGLLADGDGKAGEP
jgi:glycerophosphoryl diester phosphodiesterase